MAGFEVSIELRQDAVTALQRAIDAAIELTPAMRDIAGHLGDTTRSRFETQESPAGVPWKPSARAKAEGGRTLTLTGDLSNSITEAWTSTEAAAGPERSGGAAIYALIHQLGGTIRPRVKKALSFAGRIVASVTLPARPYVGFNDENADYVVETLADHMRRAFGVAGGTA